MYSYCFHLRKLSSIFSISTIKRLPHASTFAMICKTSVPRYESRHRLRGNLKDLEVYSNSKQVPNPKVSAMPQVWKRKFFVLHNKQNLNANSKVTMCFCENHDTFLLLSTKPCNTTNQTNTTPLGVSFTFSHIWSFVSEGPCHFQLFQPLTYYCCHLFICPPVVTNQSQHPSLNKEQVKRI